MVDQASFGDAGLTSLLILSDLHLSSEGCLRFFYHMYGDHVGSLSVIQRNHDAPSSQRDVTIFHKSGIISLKLIAV